MPDPENNGEWPSDVPCWSSPSWPASDCCCLRPLAGLGALTIARRMGISTLVIGLTIVAFDGVSELALNVIAAASGETGLAFGNVVDPTSPTSAFPDWCPVRAADGQPSHHPHGTAVLIIATVAYILQICRRRASTVNTALIDWMECSC